MSYHIDVLPGDKDKNTPFKYDKEGVIKTKIPYTQEYHYHVTSIASCALSGGEDETDPHIKWLLNNMGKDGSFKHNFTFPFYNNFPKAWVGGLAQGLAVSALVQANHVEAAKKAFKGIQNNCIYVDEQGDTWIEEYPLDEPVCILNGFIYALFGVYDIKPFLHEAENLWNDCIQTLRVNLSKYDMGYWSRYDLQTGIPSTEFYHNIHIAQMRVLFNLTTYKEFDFYRKKFQRQVTDFNIFRSKIKRDVISLNKHGFAKSYQLYKEIKEWKETKGRRNENINIM